MTVLTPQFLSIDRLFRNCVFKKHIEIEMRFENPSILDLNCQKADQRFALEVILEHFEVQY